MTLSLWSRWRTKVSKRSRPTQTPRFRPHVEVLEDRLLLSTFTVLNTNDSGSGSLRQAILDANNNPNAGGPDVIAFSIAGSGTQSIAVASALPNISEAVVLDGTSQLGYNALNHQPVVELSGAGAGGGVAGLTLAANGSTVEGLAINRFNGDGILILGNGNTVEDNYVGLDPSGSVALGNGGIGIEVTAGASGNTIGGASAGLGNVVSVNGRDGIQLTGGTTSGNVIQGNFVGTDATGTVALGNHLSGIALFNAAHDNVVGGATGANLGGRLSGAGNLVSGNSSDGVFLGNFGSGGANNNQVQGNYIGTDVNGTSRMGNAGCGIKMLDSAANNLIGGTGAGAGNVVAASGADGVQMNGQFTAGNVVEGNFLGTDVTGTAALGNTFAGVAIFNGAHDNIVGGASSAIPGSRLVGPGNLISGNGGDGVFLGNFGGGAHQNQVQGNYVGTDATGLGALGNTFQGIEMNDVTNNLIGGTTAAARNVIAANGQDGVLLQMNAAGNTIEGNFIGANAAGAALGNGASGVQAISGSSNDQVLGNSIEANTAGVNLDSSISGWTIQSNVIASNGNSAAPGNSGIIVAGGQGNAIRGNAIYANAFLGIDLGNDGVTPNDSAGHTGANLFQNFPVLTAVSVQGGNATVQGTLSSAPNGTFVVEFFANAVFGQGGYGQGQTYLGSATVTTDSTGNAGFSFTSPLVAGETVVTATATDANNNTSEFSHGLAELAATGVTVPATAGTSFTSAVATFTDASAAAVGTFSAVVDWGDKQQSTATVTQNGSTYTVNGTHTYAVAGSYTLNVTVTDTAGRTATVGSTAQVAAPPAHVILSGQTEGADFWLSHKGQALIKSFNGDPKSTALSTWLASTFVNLFGAHAGNENLTGKTNTQVAEFFQHLLCRDGRQLEQEILTTALNVYATTLSLGGNSGAAYGFRVDANGLGAALFNVGHDGSAFGVPNGTILSVNQLLKAADQRAVKGVLYGSHRSLRHQARQVFAGINKAGDR